MRTGLRAQCLTRAFGLSVSESKISLSPLSPLSSSSSSSSFSSFSSCPPSLLPSFPPSLLPSFPLSLCLSVSLSLCLSVPLPLGGRGRAEAEALKPAMPELGPTGFWPDGVGVLVCVCWFVCCVGVCVGWCVWVGVCVGVCVLLGLTRPGPDSVLTFEA